MFHSLGAVTPNAPVSSTPLSFVSQVGLLPADAQMTAADDSPAAPADTVKQIQYKYKYKKSINPTWGNYVSAPLKHRYNEHTNSTYSNNNNTRPYVIIILGLM